MTVRKQNKWALALPVLMTAIGLCFMSMGLLGYPALLVTGIFYAWIGLRGFRTAFLRNAAPPGRTSLGRPYS